MNTSGLFEPDQPLTVITKNRIDSFLPGLWEEVFKISTPPPTAEVGDSEFDRQSSFDSSILDYHVISSAQWNEYTIEWISSITTFE